MYKLSHKKKVDPNGRKAKMLPKKTNKWQHKKLKKLHKKNQQTRK